MAENGWQSGMIWGGQLMADGVQMDSLHPLRYSAIAQGQEITE